MNQEKELENGTERLRAIAKQMSAAELTELWEDALKLPVGEPVPEFIPIILAELVDRGEEPQKSQR